MLNYAGWRVVEKRGLEQEDVSERRRSVQDGNTKHARVDTCVGLPSHFTTERTENTEKTF